MRGRSRLFRGDFGWFGEAPGRRWGTPGRHVGVSWALLAPVWFHGCFGLDLGRVWEAKVVNQSIILVFFLICFSRLNLGRCFFRFLITLLGDGEQHLFLQGGLLVLLEGFGSKTRCLKIA